MEGVIFLLVLVLLGALGLVVYLFVLGFRVRGLEGRLGRSEAAQHATQQRLAGAETALQQLQARMASVVAGAAARPAAAAPTPAPEPPATPPIPAETPAASVDLPATPAAPITAPAPPAPAPAAAAPTPAATPTPTPAPTPRPQPSPAHAAATPPPSRRAPREPDVVEKLVALVKGWLFEGNVPVKLGLLVMMFGVVGALKYAADAGWLTLPDEYRVAGIAAGGIAGLIWGLKSMRERPVFGLSMQGGSIGILLLTVFAAFRYYHVLPALPAFVLIVVLVAGASVLAVRQNAPALAVLGFIGGYLAPVLISTGSGNHVALFSYFAVLNAFVFAIAWKRPWRALNLLGFVFTFAIGGMWAGKYYRPELFATVEPFLLLFFFFYVAIPVLYALAGRERNGKVDGTLLFGTPLLAFPAQVGLLHGDRMGLAASAIAVAAIYAGLALWSIRNTRLRLLAQSAAAMGVVFATLAIPLALSASWTSAAWALQAAGMVWLGLRQDKRLTRWFGLLLLVLAGGAWGFSLADSTALAGIDHGDRLLINGYALNLLVLALAHFTVAWLYDRERRAPALAIVVYGIALLWWVLFGIREIEVNLDVDSSATVYGVFAALTAMLAALLRRPLAWPRLSWTTGLATVCALPLAFAAVSDRVWLDEGMTLAPWPTWFDVALLPWWAIAAVLLLSLRSLREPPSQWLPMAHIATFLLLAGGVGVSLWRTLEERAGMGDGWWLPAGLAPLVVLFALAWRQPQLAAWPLPEADFRRYRGGWLGIAGVLLAIGWFAGQFFAGASTPLPWLPVLNPLELFLLAGLIVVAGTLRHRPQAGGQWMLWSGAALLTLTMMVLRGCHHFAGLPWSPSMLANGTAQTGLTVAWCVAGVVAWILGSQRRNRALWIAGATLLGIVLVKLMAIDRNYIGNMTGIISFVAVGALLMIVGRIAPSPPRSTPE
jgi:uncharacterized membrane protein